MSRVLRLLVAAVAVGGWLAAASGQTAPAFVARQGQRIEF